MAEDIKKCPVCEKLNPASTLFCSCGCPLSGVSRRSPSGNRAVPEVRITEVRLTMGNVMVLVLKFWLASFILSLAAAAVYWVFFSRFVFSWPS